MSFKNMAELERIFGFFNKAKASQLINDILSVFALNFGEALAHEGVFEILAVQF